MVADAGDLISWSANYIICIVVYIRIQNGGMTMHSATTEYEEFSTTGPELLADILLRVIRQTGLGTGLRPRLLEVPVQNPHPVDLETDHESDDCERGDEYQRIVPGRCRVVGIQQQDDVGNHTGH